MTDVDSRIAALTAERDDLINEVRCLQLEVQKVAENTPETLFATVQEQLEIIATLRNQLWDTHQSVRWNREMYFKELRVVNETRDTLRRVVHARDGLAEIAESTVHAFMNAVCARCQDMVELPSIEDIDELRSVK